MKKFLQRLFLFLAACILMPTHIQAQSLSTLYKAYRLAKGAYKAYEAYSVTDEELQEYMQQAIAQEDAKHKVCGSSTKYYSRLQRITKGMDEIDGLPLNFKVYQDAQTANAFASPDGSVRVYSKLMDIMTDDEVRGVLGHELGHIAGHHSLKEYKAALYVSAAREGIMATDSYGELASGVAGALVESLLNAKYSRTQEAEADDYGYDYLVEIGQNPIAIANALKKLLQLQGSAGNKYARALKTLFSTHPDLENRIAHLAERAEEDGYK